MTVAKIRIIRDYTAPGDKTPPIAEGTEIYADILGPEDCVLEPGEAWYLHPDTSEDWMSLPGDFEIVEVLEP